MRRWYSSCKKSLMGRTNKWLSGQIGRNEVTVSRWCHNLQQPDLKTLHRIADLLDVHVCELLTAGRGES